MPGPTEATVELHDRATRWLRDDRRRLLQVVTTAAMRKTVLRVLQGLELSPFAQGPFVQLDTPHASGAPGWDVRSDGLRGDYEARRERTATAHDEAWPALPVSPTARGLAGFAGQLAQLVASTPGRPPWIVILAPGYVQAVPHWSQAIAMLLRGSELGSVRWVVVDVERSTLGESTAGQDEVVRIDVGDDAGLADEVDAVSQGASDPSTAGKPGARPKDAARPPRPGRFPAVPDPERLQQRELSRLVLAANSAQRKGEHAQAVEHQRRARDLCAQADDKEQHVAMELLLGSTLLGASTPQQAELSNLRAIELAKHVDERPDLLPQAQLALGATRMSRGDRPGAMVAYAEAVVTAERTGPAVLMLEACRLAGDLALLLSMEAQAIAFWGRAVTLANEDPAAAAMGSAGHSARAMALVCDKRGLTERGRIYWDAARRFESLDLDVIRDAEARARQDAEVLATHDDQELAEGEDARSATVHQGPDRASASDDGSRQPVLGPSSTTLPQTPSEVPQASSKTLPLDQPTSSPAPVDEGTADVSIEELAALHWKGMVPASVPSAVVHTWSETEEDTIRRATTVVLTEDATSLMTREEILAIHGESTLPPARETTPEGTALIERATIEQRLRMTDPEADGTAWISPDRLAEIRSRRAPREETSAEATVVSDEVPNRRPPVAPEPTTNPPPPGDETTVITREKVLEIARLHAARRKAEKDDG